MKVDARCKLLKSQGHEIIDVKMGEKFLQWKTSRTTCAIFTGDD